MTSQQSLAKLVLLFTAALASTAFADEEPERIMPVEDVEDSCAFKASVAVPGLTSMVGECWEVSVECRPERTTEEDGKLRCMRSVIYLTKSILDLMGNFVEILQPCKILKNVPRVVTCLASTTGFLSEAGDIIADSAGIKLSCPKAEDIVDIVSTQIGHWQLCARRIGDIMQEAIKMAGVISHLAKVPCKGRDCARTVFLLMEAITKFAGYFARSFNACALKKYEAPIAPDDEIDGDDHGVAEDGVIESEEEEVTVVEPTEVEPTEAPTVNGIPLRPGEIETRENTKATCAGSVMDIIGSILGLYPATMSIIDECKVPKAERKLEIEDFVASDSSKSSPMTFALALAVPMVAVVSFLVGRRRGAQRASTMVVHMNVEDEEACE
jgi:hypothetical protein